MDIRKVRTKKIRPTTERRVRPRALIKKSTDQLISYQLILLSTKLHVHVNMFMSLLALAKSFWGGVGPPKTSALAARSMVTMASGELQKPIQNPSIFLIEF